MKIIIVSIGSDIGIALGSHWLKEGHSVFGTYRHETEAVKRLQEQGAVIIKTEMADDSSIDNAIDQIHTKCDRWDVLVMATGSQDPIGRFDTIEINAWQESLRVNFTSQMRLTRGLLDIRQTDGFTPSVIYFAGGGTNRATSNYSAYTISKIALIKMCELLDHELPDTKFTIIGPGWVKTKIHNSTLAQPDKSEENYQNTIDKLVGKDCVPIEAVVDCCNWVVESERSVVGGRNISLVFDAWGSASLNVELKKNKDMYKLRRSGNDFPGRKVPITESNYDGQK